MNMNKDPDIIVQAYEIGNNFTRIVLSDGSVGNLASALARYCDAGVKIVDTQEKLIAKEDPAGLFDSKAATTTNGEHVIKKEVTFNNEVSAYLYFTKGDKRITELDLLVLESAITSIAFILLKNQNAEEVEKSYRHEFLNDLVDGDINSKEEILQRSAFYEIDLTRSYILILINIESIDELFPSQNKKETYKLLRRTFNLAFRTFFTTAKESIVWTRSNNIIILYPLAAEYRETEENLHEHIIKFSRDIAQRIKRTIENNIENINITVGLGRYYSDITELCKSYQEAVTAVKTGKSVWGNNRIYHYDDLGFYRILERYPHQIELKSYVNEILGPLQEYDLRHKTSLVQTLKALMDNYGKQKATAEKLFIHNKTMAYRKKKIQEILNLNLDHAEDVFEVCIALKIMKILD